MSSENRGRLIARLVAAQRSSQNASDMLDEAYARLLGVNRTDALCLDIIQRFGKVTAGQLAERSGLTTGAVTTLVDRLEKRGYVRRERDPVDRRRVFIELSESSKEFGAMVYSPIGELFEPYCSRMTDAEFAIVAGYLEASDRINRELAAVIAGFVPASDAGAEERWAQAEAMNRAASGLIEMFRTDPDAYRMRDEDLVPGKGAVEVETCRDDEPA
ncbi:MarR family transcriptional regulator [Cucumibacter marinus]|uniref:MarR family transcriptional regulator n=1 Tax=Cucumibacter marinus TaxID=1121252 RepID=UPI001FE0AC0D|nr:MarR family transcriptional regulator [Cucumibacter marinus]